RSIGRGVREASRHQRDNPTCHRRRRIAMRPFRVPHVVGGRARTGSSVEGKFRARIARGCIAMGAASTLALGVATAHAVLVPLGTFGSQGSGAGQFQTPIGVAVAPTSGAVYVADSGNARVQKFDANGNFVAAWGWGVTDGQAHSEVCTANCQA